MQLAPCPRGAREGGTESLHAFARDWNVGDTDNNPTMTVSAPWLEDKGVQVEV